AICGIASLALAAAGLAGCGDKVDGTAAALVINDEEVNLGTANFYLRHQQAETANMMQSYGLTSSDLMWDQAISDSQSYGDSLKENCQDSLVNMVVLRQHAEEYGVSLTEEETQKIDETAQAVMDANPEDRKSTRLNSSHVSISYAVFCLKKKKQQT